MIDKIPTFTFTGNTEGFTAMTEQDILNSTGEVTFTNTVQLAEYPLITNFELTLADGSVVSIPCTEILCSDSTGILAASIHHLIQRVAALEAQIKGQLRD
jgi:hypothetical protein